MSTATKVSRAMQTIARHIDRAIEAVAGERVGFTLVVYTAPRASYVSNTSREESVRELKKLLAIWEAGDPDVPAHELD